jgi:hypothetical protein
MLRSIPLLALLALALGACVLPLATGSDNCVSYCGLLQGCGVSSAPAGDCNSWCAIFEPAIQQAGCQQQFDDMTSCVVGEATCEAASCDAQTQSILDCKSQYCDTNPGASLCASQ